MITLSKKQIERLPMLEDGDKGQYGTCYHYDGGVIKLSKTTAIALSKRKLIMRNIKDLVGTKVEDVSFPIDTTPSNVRYFAYKMPSIDGPSLITTRNEILSCKRDLALEDLSINYQDGKNKMYVLSDKLIEIHDMKPTDCKFMINSRLGICDVDGFIKRKYSDCETLSNNLTWLNGVYKEFLDLLVLDLGITMPEENDSENYVEDTLELIIKNTSSNTKSFGEFIKR